MVIPNFFITFVRHSFHTSHSLHIPSRERRHRLHHPATRRHTPLTAHALPHALRTRGSLARCTSQKAMLTRHAHAIHPRPHSTHALRATLPLARLCHTRHTHATHPRPHSTHALRATTPRKGLRHAALPPSMKATLLHAPTPRKFSEKKARASTTKILHITILHVTFTRIGVKTTQKSEAIFSFID